MLYKGQHQLNKVTLSSQLAPTTWPVGRIVKKGERPHFAENLRTQGKPNHDHNDCNKEGRKATTTAKVREESGQPRSADKATRGALTSPWEPRQRQLVEGRRQLIGSRFWRPEVILAVMEAGGDGKPFWRPAASILRHWQIIPRWADEQGTGQFRQHSIDHMM